MPETSNPSLGRAESSTFNGNGTPTPSMSSKTLPNLTLAPTMSNTSGAGAQSKGGKMAPKVDIEPIYTELKKCIGEGWAVYKEAVAGFILGLLSQKEFARLTDRFILLDPVRESLHNQLICAIYTNASREPPEAGVASWVSSNDKHGVNGVGGAGLKHVGGDLAEHRLRVEVMQLPPRVRGRLKGIVDDPSTPLLHTLSQSRTSSRLQAPKDPPSLLPSTSQSTNTPIPVTTNLNQSVEVRRRYNLPLATESHDLPQPSILADRITPICYEEGLPTGPREADVCVGLLSVGLEAFLKDVLVSVLGRSVVNAPISGPPPAAIVVPDARKLSGDGLLNGTGNVAPAPLSLQTTTLVATPTVSLTGAAVGITSGPRMGVLTARYKRKLLLEEAAVARGELKRTDMGLLPCEVAALQRQRELDAAMTGTGATALGDVKMADGGGVVGLGGEKEKLVGVPADLRLAWELGDQWLRDVVPWMGEKFVGVEEDFFFDGGGGDDMMLNNGVGDEMDIDADAEADGEEDTDWGWQGAGADDRAALGALLDDCLAVGQ